MVQDDKINLIKNIIIEKLNPEKIILFGSYAKGVQDENSDLDILIVIKDSNEPRFKRARGIRKNLWGITDIPKDILIYTSDEINYWLKIPFSFIYTIINEGKKIYER